MTVRDRGVAVQDKLARVSVVLASSLGCTSTEPPPVPANAPVAVEAPKPVEPPKRPVPVGAGFVASARTHVLLVSHEASAAKAQVRAVALDGMVVGDEVVHPAIEHSQWSDRRVVVAGHGGGKDWATGEADGEGWRVVLRQIGEAETQPVVVPHRPAAIHVAGSTVIVGAGPTVGSISLLSPKLGWSVARERADMQYKAFDSFARAGDWLVAVDDQVVPMYADSFALEIGGRPIHRAGWDLPGVINGHYVHPVLVRGDTGDRDGTLFVVAPYGVMDGHGHDLVALPIRGDELAVPADFTVNATESTSPPVLEEHVPRGTRRPLKLTAGTEFTEWTGLAVIGDHLLAAAGARGLLIVPVTFGPQTKAIALDVGGDCRDVLVADDRIWVLVGGEADALVEYAWSGTTAVERHRTPLPSSFTTIVD